LDNELPVDDLLKFIATVNRRMGIALPQEWQTLGKTQIARRFIEGLNQYFFQTYDGIGTTQFQGEQLQYFSDFHKFWEAHHKDILNARINKEQAKVAARCMASAVTKYGTKIFNVQHHTHGLPLRAIAQVRFFTANQDFREPPERQFEKYLQDTTRFDAAVIQEDPADFLRFLGLTRLSQTDKRLDFAKNSAGFLLSNKIKAFDIAKLFGNNAIEIREALVATKNIGYGAKKANMFIRDMVELNVWPGLSHYDEIDVASDINTMKVALRARILQTDIPIISSFLDIFCYQYGYIDVMSAKAWRAVWEEWSKADPKTAPRSPCMMDFLLYRIGREYCKNVLVEFRCDNGHRFLNFGARQRKCRVCLENGRNMNAKEVSRMLPCQAQSADLPREDGILLLNDENLLSTFEGVCIFEPSCGPKSPDFVAFDPPKSISIKGQTSWTNSYADRRRGGGGMMG
jgi:hypothetical protein